MCLQCDVSSIEIGRFGDISVQISQKENKTWNNGSIGLVMLNDPFKVFNNVEWLECPTFYLSDDEIFDQIYDTEKEEMFLKNLEKLEPELMFDAYDGFKLIQNLKKSGYDEKIHGYRWSFYFVHKVAEMLNKFKS